MADSRPVRRRKPEALGKRGYRLLVAALLVLAGALRCEARMLLLKAGAFDPAASDAPAVLQTASSHDGYWLVQFHRPVTGIEKRIVTESGAAIVSYIPENALLIKADALSSQRLRRSPEVRWLGAYHASLRVAPAIPDKGAAGEFTVLAFPGEDAQGIQKALQRKGAAVLSRADGPDGTVFVVSAPPAMARSLGQVPGVRWVEPRPEARLMNNVAAGIARVRQTWSSARIFGEGEIVAVADTGLDLGIGSPNLHPDFQGRVVAGFALGRPGLTNDPHGHGTHVAGTVLGSGVLSGAIPQSADYGDSFAGVAPRAGLVIQSLIDASGKLGGLPDSLGELFDQAYGAGARVHTNSWGASIYGGYDARAHQVDYFAWTRPDMVIVFSAGNDGADRNADGRVDPDSIATPATAKNCIAVGATESLRPNGGLQTTWGSSIWGNLFPANPLFQDPISDNPEGLAAFSSRGPCDDGRIKPDIVAPGTNIISARSRDPQAGVGWGAYNADYAYSGGTSMSAPMVAGAAALVRQHYLLKRGAEPSAALVKATLLCSAKDIAPGQYGTGSFQEVFPRPDNSQGWGRLDLKAAIDPDPPVSRFEVDEPAGLSTGQIRSYTVRVLNSSVPLRVVLVWTDYPGDAAASRALVNDLDLAVHAPGGTVYPGNGQLDRINNVEGVDIPSPAPGDYVITVSAFNVPQGPQPFALVVEGGLPRGFVSGTVRSQSGSPVPGVLISAASSGEVFTGQTDELGRYIINVPAGGYTISASRPGWSFAPPSRQAVVGETGITGLDFDGTAPAAAISGRVTLGTAQTVNGLWQSPHPYENNTTHTVTVQGPPGTVRMRVRIAEMDTEADYDFVSIVSGSGTVVAVYSGQRQAFWTPWVDGDSVRIVLTADATRAYYGWRADRFEAIVPGAPLAGAVVKDSRSGREAVSAASGYFALQGLEPLTTHLSASCPGYLLKPPVRRVTPEPGQLVQAQDFVAVPEPPVARIRIAHSYVGDLEVTLGIGNPEQPLWSQTVWNRQGGSSSVISLDVEVDDGAAFFPPGPDAPWFLQVCDRDRYDTGNILSFKVTLGDQAYFAADVPAPIVDFNCTTVLIPSIPPIRIGEAQQQIDGLPVEFWNKVVTAVFEDRVYIQEPDSSAGIAVLGASGVNVGDLVSVKGYLDRVNCERVLTSPQVFVVRQTEKIPRALRMPAGRVGGHQPGLFGAGFPDSPGVLNLGLLVCVTGRVTKSGPGYFYLSDGSEVIDGSGIRGIRVSLPPGASAPQAGSVVSVTGIAGCKDAGAGEARIIYARTPEDIVTVQGPEIIFSDDFENGPDAWSASPGCFPMMINDARARSGRRSFLSRDDAMEGSEHDLGQRFSANVGLSAWLYDSGGSGPQSQLLQLRGGSGELSDGFAIGIHSPVSPNLYCVFTEKDGWSVTGVPRRAGWVKLTIRLNSYTGRDDDVRFLINDEEVARGRRKSGVAVSRIILGNQHLLPAFPAWWDDVVFGYGQ